MATGVLGPERADIGKGTLRQDRWWISPAVTFVVFTAFIVYSTWRAFSGANYYASPYLSPFYSPCLSTHCVAGASDFGQPLGFLPTWFSPALVILIFPLGFRLTCYYYRKAYYRAFWLSPAACAVPEPHKKYTGERRFPLILQNVHRWFFYAAFVIALILTYDAVIAFRNPQHEWGHMGLGTLILLANVVLIWLYTLSCHSCRHITGGRLRNFSKHPLRYRLWTFVSKLNGHHARFAWASLISVAVADFYVYLLATGAITDVRFF
ncbi:hypothetical protein SAMN05421678_11543 [Actinopolymorpha cephalotaxi]|uniref:Uncharacterized protein n=1 Tax=Actinopolymorpha cephalotaxi TaxID=504797 RepID=A0A1I2YWI1_9ACTN|nr:hypothetical protein [Actinopolymorpha cephalotaxi]NYH81725.1 hypothetical protein [Actinopolymorpha cephalotaxi]SFH29775.1 hypothetical protein SAMN05421678_11543 [Actinopolymorpha cephalotaxi]